MPEADGLTEAAAEFADEIADLLHRTVSDDPPIRAETRADRVVVAPYGDDGEKVDVPLRVAGEHRLDLRIEYRCTWDFSGRFLAIEWSEFALKIPHLREALIRFDYVRDHSWSPAHTQLHAESSALGWLHSFTGMKRPPRVQNLHLPVGGKRFRPALEDVVEFAIHDLAVDSKRGAARRIEEGRVRWRRLQAAAAIRDVIKDDPETAPDELHRIIEEAHRAVLGARRDEDA